MKIGIYLRLPNPNKRYGGQASSLFISAFVVPVIKDNASVIIIGKELRNSVRNRYNNRSI